MMDKNQWWKHAVIYQVYTKSFQDTNGDGVGDLNGVIKHLPYIHSLGVDVIWLSPVYCSPQIDNGYDISDYRKIDPMFGTNEDMYKLIKLAHSNNIKIIMDLVANHTSDQHQWFQESCKSKDNFFSDFYVWQNPKEDGSEPNNWGSSFGGSAWTYCEQRDQYYLHYYAKEQPDLNWENPRVRQAVYDIMRFWISKGVDGWRLDVITSISKDQSFKDRPNPNKSAFVSAYQNNGPRMHEFIHEMNSEVLEPFDMLSIGEAPDSSSENVLELVSPERKELNMVLPFEHMKCDIRPGGYGHFDIQALDVLKLKKVMSDWQEKLFNNKAGSGLYFENHDRARTPSRWGNDKKYRYESATAFATILHGMYGTPFIYQGEEIGMTNANLKLQDYEDIEVKGAYKKLVEQEKVMTDKQFLYSVGKVSRDHARTPMQWDEKKNPGFSTTKPWFGVNPDYQRINVDFDLKNTKSIYRYYQQLVALRHDHNVIVDGSYMPIEPNDPNVFAYVREDQKETITVIVNLSENIIPIQKYTEHIVEGLIYLKNYESRMNLIDDLKAYEAIVILLKK